MKTLVTGLALLLLSATILYAAPVPDGDSSTITLIEKSLVATITMRAKFTQTLESKGFGITGTHTGNVSLKKPNLMLWEYDEPEGRCIVADGKRLWIYEPEEKTVYYDEQADYLNPRSPAFFLVGAVSLRDLFEVELVSEAKEDIINSVIRLRLVPKEPQPNMKAALLVVTKDGFTPQSLLMVDYLGNRNRIQFSAVKTNVELDEKMFAFQVPSWVMRKKLVTDGTH